MDPQPTIEVSSLSKAFTHHRRSPGLGGAIRSFFRRQTVVTEAVRDISFQIQPGEFVGFIGPNGAGKTTTMKMLSGVLHPSGGHVRVLGHVPQHRKDAFLKQIAFVTGQKDSLFWELPAMELFLLMRDMYEIPSSEFDRSLDTLASLLDAESFLDVQVRRLSLGQRMKCELIAALLHMPRVMFLDEPTIGLDVTSQKLMRDFFRAYNRETGATILLTSHYLDDIKSLCERIIFIDQGQILFDGPLAEVMERYAPNVRISFTTEDGAPHADKVFALGELERDEESSRLQLRVARSESTEVARQLLNEFQVTSILIEEPSLGEVVAALGRAR